MVNHSISPQSKLFFMRALLSDPNIQQLSTRNCYACIEKTNAIFPSCSIFFELTCDQLIGRQYFYSTCAWILTLSDFGYSTIHVNRVTGTVKSQLAEFHLDRMCEFKYRRTALRRDPGRRKRRKVWKIAISSNGDWRRHNTKCNIQIVCIIACPIALCQWAVDLIGPGIPIHGCTDESLRTLLH